MVILDKYEAIKELDILEDKLREMKYAGVMSKADIAEDIVKRILAVLVFLVEEVEE